MFIQIPGPDNGTCVINALMVALVSSSKDIISMLIKNENKDPLKEENWGDILLKNNFRKVILPIENEITLSELTENIAATDIVVACLGHHIVGILNNCYFDTEDSGDCTVFSYYIKPNGFNNIKYTCTKCGKCCIGKNGFAIATRSELNKIMEYTKLSQDEIVEKEYNDDIILIKHAKNSDRCMFLNDENLCEINDILPYNCKLPDIACLFIPERGGSMVLERCEGLGCGEKHSIIRINNMIDEFYKKYNLNNR